MKRFSLSFKDTVRDLMIYEFLQDMKVNRSPSQYIKSIIENDKLYIEWSKDKGGN